MMRVRVLEFLVALAIVIGLGLLAAVIMPGSGHIERSLVVGKDMRQVYDVLDNFRRLPEYSVLGSSDPQIKYAFSGKAYGPGAEVNWTSSNPKVGNGSLTIDSATPEFDKIDGTVKSAKIVWDLENNWKGYDKQFTLALERSGNRNQLTNVTWSYDVKYGWNLYNRFANLYIHGDPDSFIEFGLNNLQNVLASVPNVNYSELIPYIRQTEQSPVLLVPASIQRKDGIEGLADTVNKAVAQIQATAKKLGVNITGPRIVFTTNYGDLIPYIRQTDTTPVLLVPASIQRKDGIEGLADTVGKAVAQIEATAKKLGVNVTGPRILFTTNYGDTTYTFDVAMPIDSSSVSVNGQAQQLTAPTPVALDTSAPADAGTAAAPAAPATLNPGDHDKFGRLIVDGDVRATLAFGGPALEGEWNGTAAGVPQTRDQLKAYALTHGYKFDDVVHRSYDILAKPEVKDAQGNITSYAEFDVYLPITNAPSQTPEQEAGIKQPTLDAEGPAPASSAAPAPAATTAAPAAAEKPAAEAKHEEKPKAEHKLAHKGKHK